MIQEIKTYCDELVNEFNLIPNERKALLEKISDYIRKKKSDHKVVQLVYICTHNSRRSHFGQIWSNVSADYYNISNVQSFSGGTEVTAFHPHAIEALERIGFQISRINNGQNPVYEVFHDDQKTPSLCFSKTYDHPDNPKTEFAAIMTCGDAEENCPFIPNTGLRIATTYDDPKHFDNTPQQNAGYDERCRQIARETLYIFSKINS